VGVGPGLVEHLAQQLGRLGAGHAVRAVDDEEGTPLMP
jgi:hypothetical protein